MAPSRQPPVAVIDIGSNSGRVVVLRLDEFRHLEILSDERAPLRLARDVDARGRLSEAALDRTLVALRDFQAIARGAGIERPEVVATSAVREASNQSELVERVQAELGIAVRVIEGAEEARYSFLGAVHGLPIQHGILLDLGGGSLEVTHFRGRRLRHSWTLPLGALRLSDRFLRSDPPAPGEVRKLREYVVKTITRAEILPLAEDELLIGTGGTIRNLAKMDRRARPSPIERLHGHLLNRRRTRDVAALLSSQRRAARTAFPGLSADRADSIVGGALAVEAAMEILGARELLVSGQGLREGVALALRGGDPPSTADVREASLRSLTSRFRNWNGEMAARRRDAARRLQRVLDPEASREFREVLTLAAELLDIGRSVDYYNRHRHAASILTATDLNGFSQRDIALLAAIVRGAGDEEVSLASFRQHLRGEDEEPALRSAVLLSLADEIERRTPAGRPLRFSCRVREEEVRLAASALRGFRPRSLADRFRRAFGLALRIDRGVPRSRTRVAAESAEAGGEGRKDREPGVS